jgi:hypothetical protein
MKRALLACLPLAAATPVAASAAKTARFDATLSVSLVATWHLESTFVRDGCTFTDTTRGAKQVEFASRRPSLLTIGRTSGALSVHGRVRFLAGSTTDFSDPSYERSDCGTTTHGDPPGPQTRPFSDGTARLGSPSRGTLQLLEIAPAIERWAPDVFGAAGPPLERALGHVDERRLFDRGTRQVVVTRDYRTTTRLVGDYSGFLFQQVRWKLTLRRLAR